MSTSLLDVLSCGLAAAIILLILAVSSTDQAQDNLLRGTLFEVQVHGVHEIDSNDVKILDGTASSIGVTLDHEAAVYEKLLDYVGEPPAAYEERLDLRVYDEVPCSCARSSDRGQHWVRDIVVSVQPTENGNGRFDLLIPISVASTGEPYWFSWRVIDRLGHSPSLNESEPSRDDSMLRFHYAARSTVRPEGRS